MVASRVLLLPVIAALGYEFIYYTSRHCENPIMRIVLTPSLWLQKLTTREPDDSQIEVALAALKKVLEVEHPEKYAQPVVVVEVAADATALADGAAIADNPPVVNGPSIAGAL
jgi:uncharacterized protein YqhQ